MSSIKIITRSFAAFAFAIALPVFAADVPAQSAGAACKEALKDLAFREQMAMTDGGPSLYTNAPQPEVCKAAAKLAKENASKDSKVSGKASGGSSTAYR
jgi:hypothetical protein